MSEMVEIRDLIEDLILGKNEIIVRSKTDKLTEMVNELATSEEWVADGNDKKDVIQEIKYILEGLDEMVHLNGYESYEQENKTYKVDILAEYFDITLSRG